MSGAFEKRQKGFESKWAHDEELRFKVFARRNKLLGALGGRRARAQGRRRRRLRQGRRRGRFPEGRRRGRLRESPRRFRRQRRGRLRTPAAGQDGRADRDREEADRAGSREEVGRRSSIQFRAHEESAGERARAVIRIELARERVRAADRADAKLQVLRDGDVVDIAQAEFRDAEGLVVQRLAFARTARPSRCARCGRRPCARSSAAPIPATAHSSNRRGACRSSPTRMSSASFRSRAARCS